MMNFLTGKVAAINTPACPGPGFNILPELKTLIFLLFFKGLSYLFEKKIFELIIYVFFELFI